MKRKYSLKLKLPAESSLNNAEELYASTNYGSCIDWCMDNIENDQVARLTVYESFYSDHKPLLLEILFNRVQDESYNNNKPIRIDNKLYQN